MGRAGVGVALFSEKTPLRELHPCGVAPATGAGIPQASTTQHIVMDAALSVNIKL